MPRIKKSVNKITFSLASVKINFMLLCWNVNIWSTLAYQLQQKDFDTSFFSACVIISMVLQSVLFWV